MQVVIPLNLFLITNEPIYNCGNFSHNIGWQLSIACSLTTFKISHKDIHMVRLVTDQVILMS